ncbi:MAG: hypothetical protein JWN10_818 [Solirubrobacterales bacterium]|nr:hypothetical protein [Solirubrobacterales bacterium]
MVAVFERISKPGGRVGRFLAVASATGAAVLVVAGAATSSSALAGEYHLYSCRTPSGESAPADGWSGSATGPESLDQDTCSQPGGALIAGLRAGFARTANSDSARWAFESPAGEKLAAATLWRAGDTDGGSELYGTYQFWLAGSGETTIFEECMSVLGCSAKGKVGQPLSPENRATVPGSNLGSHLYATASCGGVSPYNCPSGGGDPNGYAAVVYLYAADLTLEQSTPPTASNVSGELASAPAVSGTSDVVFSASDPGSGVYEAVFSVDGKVVQSTVLNENAGRCRNVGQTSDGLAAFLYVQPCPASVSADVGFDTTAVSNGQHHVVVSVTDAAGNAATVLDRDVTVDNPPPPGGPNGTNASSQAALSVRWAGTDSERLVSRYGHAETILGRLVGTDGVPIVAAHVNVLSRPEYAGAQTAAMTSVRTDSNGRFTLRLPARAPSRTLSFEYSDELGSPPVVTKTLTVAVRAAVGLSIAPRTARIGSTIHFSGRLRGGPIPKGGKLVVLEARSPGGAWLEFNVIRSGASGRFHASYRFKFAGPAKYQFRALCEAEADYPYATGASHVVTIFER